VAEQLLDGADVVAVGEHVGREAVAEARTVTGLATPAWRAASLKARWTVRSWRWWRPSRPFSGSRQRLEAGKTYCQRGALPAAVRTLAAGGRVRGGAGSRG